MCLSSDNYAAEAVFYKKGVQKHEKANGADADATKFGKNCKIESQK